MNLPIIPDIPDFNPIICPRRNHIPSLAVNGKTLHGSVMCKHLDERGGHGRRPKGDRPIGMAQVNYRVAGVLSH